MASSPLKGGPRELVGKTVEEMLVGLLDEEADDLVGAERYKRTADRETYRAGHYERKPTAIAGGPRYACPAHAQGFAVRHGNHRAEYCTL